MLKLQEEGFKVSIDYFTGNLFSYSKTVNGIKKRFWTIAKPLLEHRHTWRRQYSWAHYIKNYFEAADVTIINMSGHGSKYCFKLAKLLRKKGKPYIAMIGGVHLSTEGQAKEYFQNAHHLIVHTEVQKNEMLQLKTFKNLNIQVMPLGIDTADYLKITEHLDFIETVEQRHLVPYYQESSLLLLPSAHESFGMVMVEAMACGTPVAALKGAGGPDEIIEDGVNGILATKETFAERILEFVQSEEMERTLSSNAIMSVEERWSLVQTEDALRESINQVFVNL